ncbi:MAG: hypothetical protein NTZ83_04895, partial [Candidatus Pacearchaeota archaeon]|nr:hypothetical protein [Candidatus Pacearchaeota archaeon]
NIDISYENIPNIIEAMSFDKRSKRNPEKCPYYQKNPPRPCHEVKELNCLLCACPNYNSKELEGGCTINSKRGEWFYHQNLPAGRVWDCSDCNVNHSKKEIENYLKKNMEKLTDLANSI